jgi:hypothetical protein
MDTDTKERLPEVERATVQAEASQGDYLAWICEGSRMATSVMSLYFIVGL